MMLSSCGPPKTSGQQDESSESLLDAKSANLLTDHSRERRLKGIIAVQWLLILILVAIPAVNTAFPSTTNQDHGAGFVDQIYCENISTGRMETQL